MSNGFKKYILNNRFYDTVRKEGVASKSDFYRKFLLDNRKWREIQIKKNHIESIYVTFCL